MVTHLMIRRGKHGYEQTACGISGNSRLWGLKYVRGPRNYDRVTCKKCRASIRAAKRN